MGGVFESRDGGKDWTPVNKGCAVEFLPMLDPEYGHDPHCVQLHPVMPDRLYQQNHCGIYRMDRSGDPRSDRWVRIGDNMPKRIGDIGFPIAVHPRDPDTVWVFPMDGTAVWLRVSPGGKPASYVTHDAGKTWTRQSKDSPRAKPGGPSSVRLWPSTPMNRSVSIWGRPAVKCGRAAQGARAGLASPVISQKYIPWK